MIRESNGLDSNFFNALSLKPVHQINLDAMRQVFCRTTNLDTFENKRNKECSTNLKDNNLRDNEAVLNSQIYDRQSLTDRQKRYYDLMKLT